MQEKIKNMIPEIGETLKIIEEQTGLNLKLCDYFTDFKEVDHKKYFNVMLKESISESKEYDILLNFSKKYNTIKILPNGYKRVAIFLL